MQEEQLIRDVVTEPTATARRNADTATLDTGFAASMACRRH